MNRADSPKPPVAPKPKTTRTLPPVTAPKLPSSPRPDGLHSPNFMSRGPKPPIAPKPKLAAPNEWRASVSVNNSLNKCSNGRLLCVDRGLCEGFRPSLECSESETDEDYIVAPRAPPKENKPEDGSCGEDVVTVALSATGEEAHEEVTQTCGGEGLPAADDSAGGALSGEDEEGANDEEGIDHTPEDEDSPQDLGTREEDEELAAEQNLGSPEDNVLWDGEGVSEGDIILTLVDPDEEPRPPEALGEVEEDDRTSCANMEPGGSGEDNAWCAEDDTEALPENEDLATGIQEAEVTRENSEVSEQECDATEDPADEAAGPDPDEQTEQEEMVATPTEAQEDLREGEDGELAEDEASEESCHIVPFENECVDDFPPSLAQSPYEFFPTESTSFCGESSSPLPEPAKSSNPECEPRSGPCMEEDLVAGEGLCVPDVVVVPEEEGEDTTDDALANPYVMGVIPTCQADPGEGGQEEISADGDTLTSCGLREELDADGGSLSMDRKNLVARARPHSGKVAGSVPETVPEETGPEAGTLANNIEECPEQVGKTALSSLFSEGKPMEVGRALPAKPRAFTLYPRSFSVEGREVPACMSREPDGLDNLRIKRKDDNLSLPCVIGSSGSFSQRNHLPSSGTSTPSSMVDIPPPFDLACITKKPITKSSPSLLTESDSPDKHPKKKKSSFKRFLELTFRKKTENKVHVDVNVSSSRSSSESSYHGPARILELDRRSLSNSPQLKARPGKLRASDSPSSLIFYRDSKRRGVPFSRTVSRVESFEDRSRPPFLPLPLTKPRSISFPNADTSDYENIPAMNSDYENIQIPPRRPARVGTFTKLFEDQSRALSTANENDGYVDMSSFNAFESKQQNAEQDAESAYTEPYKVCPISVVAPREDLTSDEEQRSSEEEEEGAPSLTHKVEGHSRALAIAQELLSSEKAYVEMLQHLHLDFHGAVLRVLDDLDQESGDPLAHKELRQGLGELPAILDLHQGILEELQARLSDWEVQQKVANVFLTREQDFDHHAAHILQFDRYLGLLTESCQRAPQLAAAIQEFEQSQRGGSQSVKHRLLRVVQRLFQYQVLLTDYLNNLCPDSAEYDATQGALTLISKVTDRANDSMEQGENLQKLVHIEHSVRGQGDLLQPGREFLKEGTLLKVTGKNRHPRHLFLMSDMLLYTYPLKDGKYRLRSSLPVSGMKVSRPVTEKVPYALKIETPECCLMLSASSCAERDEWYGCLSRALPEDYKAQALAAFHHSVEIRERLGVSLGERPPTLVPVTHVMMCMNCGCDFSLTLRRHHCHACGKIVCRNCSRNKYPLKYLKDRMAKVCDGCFGELKKRGGPVPSLMRERPVSMSFPLSSARFSGSAFSSVFHGINPSAFKKQKKVPSALTEVAASGEGSAISGYLSRCKKGKRHWKKLWFVIKGKVLYTYMASEDKVAMESMPLLGFTIAPEREEGSSQGGPVFHLYHKKTLFYSFKAEDASSAQRWIEAMEDASVL